MDESNKFAFMLCVTGLIIAAMLLIGTLYNDIHEEKMVQLGCSKVYILDRGYHWECGKDK